MRRPLFADLLSIDRPPSAVHLIPLFLLTELELYRIILNQRTRLYRIIVMHPLLKYILWPLFIYIAYCTLLFLLQRQIMFPRGMIPQPESSADSIPGLEKIWLETEFGKVESWLLQPVSGKDAGPAAAVIFGHGNGELIDFWPDDFKGFTRFGMAVLLVEYPGYGRSAGSPSQQSITEAFVAAYDMLTARKNIDSSRIVLFGRSLGGGAVCALSLRRPSAALILMSTFTSARTFAKRYLAPAFLVRDPFNNLAAVEKYQGPLLIMHGRHDTIVPFSHGTALREAAGQGKLIAYEAGHNDCPPDWHVFWKDIEAFLRRGGIIG
jgi:pimeloyl-ACP methyl ester carboxylesterase